MVPTRETLVTHLLTTYYILTLLAIQVQVKEFQVMVDDNLANLNPLSVGPGRHFNCTFKHANRGCVTDSENVPKTCHKLTPCNGEATITITFDYSTGIIEKAEP